MNSIEIPRRLREIAEALAIVDPQPFRARAYERAARTLEAYGPDWVELARRDALTTLPGIGPSLATTIRELWERGTTPLWEELRRRVPPSALEMARLPGLGIKRVRTLLEHGIDSIDRLEAALTSGQLAQLPGFGPTVARKLAAVLASYRAQAGRLRYAEARVRAEALLAWLTAQPGVDRAEVAGEVRRALEIVGQLVFVVASRRPALLARLDSALAERAGPISTQLLVVPPDAWGAALAWATGNDRHREELQARATARGWRWAPDGLRREGRRHATPTEEAFYRALDLPWIPPELREGEGEIDAAATGRLPCLVELADLRGTFHCHTRYSDGTASVQQMASGAHQRGWQYLGLADHSQAAYYAGGLAPEAIAQQRQEVSAWNAEHPKGPRLFHGIESDILRDGRLDYDDATLAGFDYVVGSVHSHFGLDERTMTQRFLRAVAHPALTILGHPTGRLLLRRDPYAFDFDAVVDAAAAHGVVLELNADPARLDLDWRLAKRAADRGVLFAINPDAHSVDALDFVDYGVRMARKAWLSPDRILNTRDVHEIEAFFAERRARHRASVGG
jgi:DNA polymerase (family 10)